MPFYSGCADFVTANLPNLAPFGAMCQAAGVTVPPPPPAGSGGASTGYAYVEVTFALDNAKTGTANSKKLACVR